MSKRFGDYEVAMAVRDAAKKAAREEIAQQRPPSRWARVASIDPATRSCMVVFNGETDAVRVPYSSVIPTREGQEVRIGGARDDRVIEAVKGETQPETRLFDLESEIGVRQVMAVNYGLNADFPVGTNTPTDIPFNFALWDPLNMPDPVNGAFGIPRYGYYEINAKVGFSAYGWTGNEFRGEAWLYCLPADGSARFALAWDAFVLTGGSADTPPAPGVVSLSFSELPHLFPGDRIVLAASTNQPAANTDARKVWANRTRINISLKYGMERYYRPEI